MTTATDSPIPRTTLLVKRSKEGCHCHGPSWVVACPDCGRNAWAWRSSRPGRPKGDGWSCVGCGARGTYFDLLEGAA